MKFIVIKIKKGKISFEQDTQYQAVSIFYSIFVFGYLFYCISCVLIANTCHIVLLCVFLLLGYYKFYKGILLAFLRAVITTVILMFYYYYSQSYLPSVFKVTKRLV